MFSYIELYVCFEAHIEKLNARGTRTKGERVKEMGCKTPVLQRAAGSSAQPNEGRGIPLVLYCQPRTRECQLSAPSLPRYTHMHAQTHLRTMKDAEMWAHGGRCLASPGKMSRSCHSTTLVHREAEKALFLLKPSLAEYHHVS